MLSPLDTIPEHDGRTDGQIIAISISHVSIAVLTCYN